MKENIHSLTDLTHFVLNFTLLINNALDDDFYSKMDDHGIKEFFEKV